MNSFRSKVVSALLLLVRLALGAVFVYAAWVKLREPWLLFAMSIDAYQVLPQWAVLTVARTLPWLELALGILLFAGRWRRLSSVAASALLMLFFSLMVRAYIRGQTIDCGCFGPGEAISPLTLLRDGSLLAGALLLTILSFRRPGGLRTPPQPAGGALVPANAVERGDHSA
ncbi:MAG: DoxX family membrane protein [Acidobacteriia bacterium]|nr:DoxX family membrane protein [Terriglobia bacterium]